MRLTILPETKDKRRMIDSYTTQALNQASCSGRCAVGSGGKSVGYLAHGTATDYMYEKLHVPLPFTWEIFGDDSAPYDDCFRMFNPLSKQQVDAVVEQWVTAVFMMLELLPQHPAIPQLNAAAAVEQHAEQGVPSQQLVRAYVARRSAGHALAALQSFEVRLKCTLTLNVS